MDLVTTERFDLHSESFYNDKWINGVTRCVNAARGQEACLIGLVNNQLKV